MKIISKEDFNSFVNALIKDDSWNVIGVKSKGTKFAFGPIESASELKLDYDVTLLPPKKYFFPQRETLFTYNLAGGFSAKNPLPAPPSFPALKNPLGSWQRLFAEPRGSRLRL